VNAECYNTVGSYTCRPCFPGFNVGDATTCSKPSCFFVEGEESILSCNMNDHTVVHIIQCILRTIKDWDLLHQRHFCVLFLQGYCALQELLMKMNFTLAVA